MRLLCILFLSVVAWGQAYTFPQVSTDLTGHTFTLPIPCPSTNPPDCTGHGANPNNQALNGAGSIWAECDFATTAPLNNPECPTHTTPATQLVASNVANAIANQYVHLIRATDSSTGSASSNWYGTFSDGQWGEQIWDSTATRLGVSDGSHNMIILSFVPNHTDPNYLKVTKLYPGTSWPIKSGWFSRQPASSFPSGQTVSLFYTVLYSQNIPGMSFTDFPNGHVLIASFDFSSATTAPTYIAGNTGKIHVIKDLSVTGCLGAYSHPSNSLMVMNAFMLTFDDNYFKFAVQSSGQTGSYNTQVLYDKVANKCIVWQTDTGIVTSESGTTGSIVDQVSVLPFTTHSSGSGNMEFGLPQYSFMEADQDGSCTPSGACTFPPKYTWETGIPYAGNPSPTGLRAWNVGPSFPGQLGHWAGGFSHMAMAGTNSSDGFNPQYIGTAPNVAGTVVVLNGGTITFGSVPYSCYDFDSSTPRWCPSDDHGSWAMSTSGNDDAPVVKAPYNDSVAISPNTSVIGRVPAVNIPWMNELDIWPTVCRLTTCTPGVKAWRPIHTYSDENLAIVWPLLAAEPITSVASASGGTTVYTGTFANNYAGYKVWITGFTNPANNGQFTGQSSTATTLTVVNSGGVAETHAATAGRQDGSDYPTQTAAGSVTPYPVDSQIFVAFTSNWQGQLGCQSPAGTYDTTYTPPGPACSWPRADVFIVQIPGVVSPATGSGYFYPWHR